MVLLHVKMYFHKLLTKADGFLVIKQLELSTQKIQKLKKKICYLKQMLSKKNEKIASMQELITLVLQMNFIEGGTARVTRKRRNT